MANANRKRARVPGARLSRVSDRAKDEPRANADVNLLTRCIILAHIEDEIRDLRDAIDWTTCEDKAGEVGYDGSNHSSIRTHEVTCFQHTGEWATACEPCKANKMRMSEITRQKQARRRAIASICKAVKSSGYQWTGGAKP